MRFSIAALMLLGCGFANAAQRPNVLMILVDDLKPALGCYGDSVAVTPNLDALAARSMRFDAAYCNQAVCAPSRFTLMTGSHSTSTGLYGLGSQLRTVLPDATTLPQFFERHGGYRTESLGKVFHIGHGNQGDPESFSVPHFAEKVIEYVDPKSTPGGKLTREEAFFTNQKLGQVASLPRGAAFEHPSVDDDAYADGRVAAETVRRLAAAKQRLNAEKMPFFIVAGFARPHLPFSAPQKYWDLYDPSGLPMPKNEDLPAGSPKVAGKRGGEIRNYFPVPDKGDPEQIDRTLKRKLIHGYYASTSYVDAQIGKVLDGLEDLNLSKSTIVVLWGDHGFHLGDLGIWTKHTNYEQANRIPILISAPGVTKPGSLTGQLTESVDIYPTLAELAGLPNPGQKSGVSQPIDGVSLVPVLKDPDTRVRDHAYHVYPRARQQLGRAIRTDRYRMVQWNRMDASESEAKYELYDYETDPFETKNLADEQPKVVDRLKKTLAKHPAPVSRNQSKSKPAKSAASDANGNEDVTVASDKTSTRRAPNIVFIIADDCTFRDIGCYGGQAHTPNINALAGEGMRFERCFQAAPMCSPTRHHVYTGQYPVKTGAYPNHTRVDPGTQSLVQYLRPLGYRIAHTGKSHVHPPSVFAWQHFGKGKLIDYDAMDEFMRGCQRESDPFCLLVCSNEPHSPWNKGDRSRYPDDKIQLPPYLLDTPETRDAMARYLAEITYFDGQVGKTLELLERRGVAEDTLVMVVSEQGNSLPFAKWTCYDSGLQSACIVRWPGVVRPGSVNPAMIEYVDFLPTFIEAAGGTPADVLDGKSLLPVLNGQTQHKDFVFGEMTTVGIINGSEHFGIRSVRSERFKYIWNFTPEVTFRNACTKSVEFQSWEAAAERGDVRAQQLVNRYRHRPAIELYDIIADPLEMKNLAGDSRYRGVQADLRAELDRWMEYCGDQGQVTELNAEERQVNRRRKRPQRNRSPQNS